MESAGLGGARQGTAGRGAAWRGWAWHGAVWPNDHTNTRRRSENQLAGQGLAWRGRARLGGAWLGKAWGRMATILTTREKQRCEEYSEVGCLPNSK